MTTLNRELVTSFTRGIPPQEAIPADELSALTRAVLHESPAEAFQYAPIGGYQGDPQLRAELAAEHGTEPDAVFVGNGSLQVLDLLAALLVKSNRQKVAVEAPTYDRSVQIFERHGARVVGVPTHADGMDMDLLGRLASEGELACVYVVPDFQNPTGATLSEQKRRILVELSAEHGFTVVEDVPYRELRYHGTAPPGIRQIDVQGAHVITLGSLSKILSPGLRVGYAIADPAMARSLAHLAEATYLSPSPLCQRVAARALADGLVTTAIERLRALLAPRHDAAVESASKILGDALLCIPNGGYYLGAHVRTGLNQAQFSEAALAHGVVLTAGAGFYPGGSAPPAGSVFVRLPFQSMDPEHFAEGIRRLAEAADHARP